MTDDVVMCVFLSERLSLWWMTCLQSAASDSAVISRTSSPVQTSPKATRGTSLQGSLASQVVQCGWPPPWWSGQLALGSAKPEVCPLNGNISWFSGGFAAETATRIPQLILHLGQRGLTWAPPLGILGLQAKNLHSGSVLHLLLIGPIVLSQVRARRAIH